MAEITGQKREWDADITEQIPDQRISWCSTDGATNSGVVTFHRLGNSRSRVMLQLGFEPEGGETGAWRGEVHQDPRSDRQFAVLTGQRPPGAYFLADSK